MNNELLEVGDTLITRSCFGDCCFLITRVTKNLAKSLCQDDGYEHTFKRHIGLDMAHPKERSDTLEYIVKRKKTNHTDKIFY